MKVYAGNRFRHVKSGHLYEVLTMALREEDLSIQVVYQRVGMGSDEEPPIWVRPARDFFDGRFEMLPGAQEKPADSFEAMTEMEISNVMHGRAKSDNGEFSASGMAASREVDRQLAEMLDREGRAREADMMAATAAKAERGKKPTVTLWDSAGNPMKMGDKVRRTDGSPMHYLVAGFDSTARQVLCREPDTSTLWWPAKELVKVDETVEPSDVLCDSAGNPIEVYDMVRWISKDTEHQVVSFDKGKRLALCDGPGYSRAWVPVNELLKVENAGEAD